MHDYRDSYPTLRPSLVTWFLFFHFFSFLFLSSKSSSLQDAEGTLQIRVARLLRHTSSYICFLFFFYRWYWWHGVRDARLDKTRKIGKVVWNRSLIVKRASVHPLALMRSIPIFLSSPIRRPIKSLHPAPSPFFLFETTWTLQDGYYQTRVTVTKVTPFLFKIVDCCASVSSHWQLVFLYVIEEKNKIARNLLSLSIIILDLNFFETVRSLYTNERKTERNREKEREKKKKKKKKINEI